MWQWLNNLWGDESRVLFIALAVVGVIIAALISLFVYRLVFGSRLRVPGSGRARQPRLGLVDAFWLDGQRQLVLVRRDNVEHLLMIGGPTDVVVESQIVRSGVPMPAPTREREAATPKLAPAAATGAANPLPSPPEPTVKPPLVVVASAPPVVAPRAGAPVVVSPDVPTPVAEPAPKTVEKPAERAAPELKRSPAPQLRVEPIAPPTVAPPKAEVVAKAEPAPARIEAPPPRPTPPARPVTLTRPPLPPPITAGGAWPRAAPPGPKAAEPKPPEAPRVEAAKPPPPPPLPASPKPPPAAPPAPPPSPSKGEDPFADLESLEAEMARLLGRDP